MNAFRIPAFLLAVVLLLLLWHRGFGFSPTDARAIAALAVLPYLFLLVSHGPGEIGAAFRDLARTDHTDTPVERLVAGTTAFDALGRYSLAVGVLGTFWAILGGMNEVARAGAAVGPRDIAPMLSQAFLLPALGVFLRWFVYGPMADSLRGAGDVFRD